MNLFFILGNQLFPLKYLERYKKNNLFYMAEDYEITFNSWQSTISIKQS